MKSSAWMLLITGFIIGTALNGAAFAARPGEVDDPLISLSYLKTGAAFRQIALNDGEKISVASGQEFILVEGKVRFECAGGFQAHDVSKGKYYSNPKNIERGDLVIFTGNSSISIYAIGGAECLVRGMMID